MHKNYAVSCKYVFAVLVILFFQGCDIEQDEFLVAISQVPRISGTDKTDIALVVKKHIPAGTTLQDAERYLEVREFKVFPYKRKNVPLGQKWFLAEKERSYKVFLTERTRVIIESDVKKFFARVGGYFWMDSSLHIS